MTAFCDIYQFLLFSSCVADASSETPTARRLYTASGPPEGYVPCWPEPSSCGSPEHASSGDDTEGKMLGGRKGGHLCR